MIYLDFKKLYPHLNSEDYEEYILFLANRATTEAWHKSVNPQRMKEFFEVAIINWRNKNEHRPSPKLDYLINYAEGWLQERLVEQND